MNNNLPKPRKYYRYPDLNERERAKNDMLKAFPGMRFNWGKLQDEDTKLMQVAFWGGCWAIDAFLLENELRSAGIMREDEFLDNAFFARFSDGDYKAEITNALICPSPSWIEELREEARAEHLEILSRKSYSLNELPRAGDFVKNLFGLDCCLPLLWGANEGFADIVRKMEANKRVFMYSEQLELRLKKIGKMQESETLEDYFSSHPHGKVMRALVAALTYEGNAPAPAQPAAKQTTLF